MEIMLTHNEIPQIPFPHNPSTYGLGTHPWESPFTCFSTFLRKNNLGDENE